MVGTDHRSGTVASVTGDTTFNGVPLPAIASFDPASGQTQIVRRFGYADYKNRLS